MLTAMELYARGHNYRQISDEMHISAGKVHNLLHYHNEKLRRNIQANYLREATHWV